jgi:PhzF family phenazine biosynthesis protein
MRLPLFHVDAFTVQAFHGNSAAVCLLDSWLDDRPLEKVAGESNLSATAFLVARENSLELRWFTPRCEIRLCGHATLATAHLMFTVLRPELDEVRFATRFSGVLTVRQDGNRVAMDFPAFVPQHRANVPPDLPDALGLEGPPSEVLEANDTLIAVLDSPEIVRRIRPDFVRLEKLHPHAVIVTAPGNDSDFVSRYFAPGYGVPEDAVTGSAHCSLAPYWSKRLGKSHLHARQLSLRGGELWCELARGRVLLKGNAVVTMQGSLTI